MLSSVIQRVKNGWHEVRTVCWMKWRFSGQWNVRLLRSVSDSVFQLLHSVVTKNNIRGVFKKRPNFLNSAPTSTECALRLLSAPSGRFGPQVWLARYFKSSVFFFNTPRIHWALRGFKFCCVDGVGSAKAGVIAKLIDSSLPHFYRISGFVLLYHATVLNTGDLFRHWK
jgi:hypothetical protein